MKNMNKIVLSIFIAVLSVNIYGQEKIMVLEDAFVQGGNTSDAVLGVEDSKQLKVFNSKKTTKYARTTYLKFELPEEAKQASKITLHIPVKVYDKNAPGNSFQLDVYATKTNNWSESKLTFNNKPEISNLLATKSLPATEKHTKVSIDLDVNQLKNHLKESKTNVITLALLNNDFNKTSAMMPSKEKSKKVASFLTIVK